MWFKNPDHNDPEAGFHATFSKSAAHARPSNDNATHNTYNVDTPAAYDVFLSSEEATLSPSLTPTPICAISKEGSSLEYAKVRVYFKGTESSMSHAINFHETVLRRSHVLAKAKLTHRNGDLIHNFSLITRQSLKYLKNAPYQQLIESCTQKNLHLHHAMTPLNELENF